MGLWLCHTCTMKEKLAKKKEESDKALEKSNEPEIVPSPRAASPEESTQTTSLSGTESQVTSQEPVTADSAADIAMEVETAETKESESASVTTTTTTSSTIDSEPIFFDEVSITKEPKEVEVVVEPASEAAKDKEEENTIEEKEELSPFEELIRVASLLNPKQFELPVEMTQPFPFIGTERVEQIKNGRRVKNKRLIELDSHGCVPLPAKLCFSCNKSCKRAPLISCDYCSLFYHQDCLDPPMTALPAGRWMCPNHPNHFIVSSFSQILSQSLTLICLSLGLELGDVNISD